MNEKEKQISILSPTDIEKNLKFNFIKYLTKQEKELLKFIKLEKFTSVSIPTFLENFSFENLDEIIKFFNNFMNKSISIYSQDNSLFININILQSFYIKNNTIYLIFSDEILTSFKKGSLFNKLGLQDILFFDEKYSYRLYQYLLGNYEEKIFLSINDLREILEISDSYKRFFDIEKNILIPIFEDIQKNSDLNIFYDKVKSGEHKSAKILGIHISKILKNTSESSYEFIDNLIIKLGKNIKNFSEIYDLLIKTTEKYGEEFVKSKIEYVLNNYEIDIEKYIKLYLSEEKNIEKADFIIEKIFKSLFEMHKEILNFIHNNNLPSLSKYMFTIALYSLKDKETTILKDKNMSIKIKYNKHKLSTVEFFIKK